jgi:hypothetical protein
VPSPAAGMTALRTCSEESAMAGVCPREAGPSRR